MQKSSRGLGKSAKGKDVKGKGTKAVVDGKGKQRALEDEASGHSEEDDIWKTARI